MRRSPLGSGAFKESGCRKGGLGSTSVKRSTAVAYVKSLKGWNASGLLWLRGAELRSNQRAGERVDGVLIWRGVKGRDERKAE